MSLTELQFPPIDAESAIATAKTSASIAVVAPSTPDLTKIDLTDVALAQFGDWRDDVKKTKANLSTLVLDLSTPTKIKEARTLRTRVILDPLAALRKVSATIKSKMAQTSKQVGLELTLAEAGYEEADGLILPQIVKAEEELEREREAARKAEAERRAGFEAKIYAIRACVARCEGISSARIANGIAQLEAMPTPTTEEWQEFAVPAANAICETLDKMRQLHAKALADEAAEAERMRRAAELAEQERRLAAERAEIERQRAELEAARALQLQAQQQIQEAVRASYAAQAPAEPIKAPDEQHAPPQSVTTAEAVTRSAGAPYTPQQGANRDASAEQSHVAEGSTSPTGRGADGPIAGGAAPVLSSKDEPATLKLGAICERLGFTVKADFLSDTLNIQPARVDGASRLYTEAQFTRICAALVSHIGAMQTLYGAEQVQ